MVLKADPRRVDALIYRASAYRALNRLDPALADVDTAVRLAPNSAPALLERGNIRGLKGDIDGARQDWQAASALAPGSAADIAAKANLTRSESPAPPRIDWTAAVPAACGRDARGPRSTRGPGLKIEIGVVLRRRQAGDVVGEERTKARPRLDARVPFLGGLVLVPRHVAEVVEARQLRRGGDVGDREMVAGEPAPPLDQVADVVEMIGQVGVPGANRLRVRLAVAGASASSSSRRAGSR